MSDALQILIKFVVGKMSMFRLSPVLARVLVALLYLNILHYILQGFTFDINRLQNEQL